MEMVLFEERGKPEYQGEDHIQIQLRTEPTYDAASPVVEALFNRSY